MRELNSHSNPRLDHWTFGDGVPAPTMWYRFCRRVFQISMSAYTQIRVFNRCYEPAEGGVVYISNHQSFFDPMLMAFALRRPVNFMARDSLFRFAPFRKIITSVNAFPVKRNTADTGAIKEAMRRIKAGGQVVIFAEGTRTPDGRIQKLLPGVAMLSQRVAQWTVPVLIEGAFEAWPKSLPLPLPGEIVVQYGRPIPQEETQKHAPADFVEIVRRQLIDIQADVRRRMGKKPLNYG